MRSQLGASLTKPFPNILGIMYHLALVLTPLEFVYNKPNPSIIFHVKDSSTLKPLSIYCKMLSETSYTGEQSSPPHAVKLNINLASKPTYWRSSRRSAPCWNIKMSFFILKLLNYMKEVTLENT
jgi:hypothetical protein